MKVILFVLILTTCFFVVGCGETVDQQIEILQKEIIPPAGTPENDVVAVYGLGESKKSNRDSRIYTAYFVLLDPNADKSKPLSAKWKAILIVEYKNSKIFRASINHLCVAKSRMVCLPDSKQSKLQAAEIRREKIKQLEDLKEIRKKYLPELKKSSWWNKK